MKQQTVVSWLEEELKLNLKKVILEGDSKLIESLFEQAKEMFEKQIINARHNGRQDLRDNGAMYKEDKQYYNETFKSE
jgi:hypothetical protein